MGKGDNDWRKQVAQVKKPNQYLNQILVQQEYWAQGSTIAIVVTSAEENTKYYLNWNSKRKRRAK